MDDEIKKEPRGEWDMPNKNKTYRQVVKEKDQLNTRHDNLKKDALLSMNTINTDNHPHPQEDFDVDLEKLKSQTPDVISVSKECASCAGFAPQILSHLKIACLSYMNSPIKYHEGVSLSIHDVLRIKQAILKKTEIANAGLSQFLASNQSNYGMMDRNQILLPTQTQPAADQILSHAQQTEMA